MRGTVEVTGPEIAFTIGTRATLGVGLGLLLANRISEDNRRAVGGTLLLAGVFAAAVLASALFGRPRPLHMTFGQEAYGRHSSDADSLRHETVRAGD